MAVRRYRSVRVAGVLAAALALSLPGCSGESAPQPMPVESVSVADMQRFPAPPDSRSMGAMDEPEASYGLPVGALDQDGTVPLKRVEGRVFRRVSMVSSGGRFDALLEHYRGLLEEGGYQVIFACEGVEDCGGAGFVGQAIEGYVTAPGNVSRARSVLTLTDPGDGELAHLSLARDHAGVAEYVGITVSRSENGPLAVVTQQAFVPAGD